jgi:predicted MFS family arabinose efflux permease
MMKVEMAFTRGYRGYFLVLTAVILTFAVIDRIALLTMGQAIKMDLALSDFEFGLVSGLGFAAVYIVAGLPLARLADTRNRVRLISIAVGIWSVFATLSGFARSFMQLMLCRIVIGIGEAGVQPPATAVASDLFPPRSRGFALAVLSVGLPAGTLIGAIGAGYLADVYGWRSVFLFLGIPGVLLAALAWLTLREPPRGLSEQLVAAPGTTAPTAVMVFRHLWSKRSFRHLVVALSLTHFVLAGIGSFVPQYLIRAFQLSMGQMGILYGLIGGGITLIGSLTGGVIVDRLSTRDVRWYAWLSSIGVLAGAPLYIVIFGFGLPVIACALAMILGGALLFLHYSPTQVVLQNMVEPRMRATAAFVFFFITSMVGYGAGPALLGLLSDTFAARAFGTGDFAASCVYAAPATPAVAKSCRLASAAGMSSAMAAMSCLYFWAAAHFFRAARTLREDLGDTHGIDPGRATAEPARHGGDPESAAGLRHHPRSP